MGKYILSISVLACVAIILSCGSSKNLAETPRLTYESDLSTVIMNNCTPCHIPAKGGFKKAYDNYANVKTDIDEMIRRMELDPSDKGFMPFKKKARLPDSTIAVFKRWRADGLREK
ncbi:MAG TPA: hypothetical protein VEB63_06630 [Chitinophagaceae bacterium]|nr:hypothetical protein [Chitinophagaceae bacterium]